MVPVASFKDIALRARVKGKGEGEKFTLSRFQLLGAVACLGIAQDRAAPLLRMS
jgi:hypothetical protein